MMTDQECAGILDAASAYAVGATDSGVHDPDAADDRAEFIQFVFSQ